ncbi:MAG: Spy/CpxP family protein refolding chaperone [Acidobacteriota bacterium]
MTQGSIIRASRMILAVFTLLAVAALMVAPIAMAQDSRETKQAKEARPAAKASPAVVAKPDQVEERIADLHAKLGIKPDQEETWTNLAQVMRDNAAKMKALLDKWAQGGSSMTAVESLKVHEEMALEHAKALNRLIPAFENLYVKMAPDQKAAADKIFATHEGRSKHKRR